MQTYVHSRTIKMLISDAEEAHEFLTRFFSHQKVMHESLAMMSRLSTA